MKYELASVVLSIAVATAVFVGNTVAVETSTVGSQTNQANVDVLNSKIDSLMASLQALVNGISTCSAQRKFYAPSDSKKDASGCVGIQDYQLTMNSTNGVATGNGMLLGQSNSTWAIEGIGTASGYGVYGQSPNIAMYAANTGNNNWTGVVQAGSSPYGLYIGGSASSMYGLYVDNNYHNAQLCLNGTCTASLGHGFGGQYMLQYYTPNGAVIGCAANPYTGNCGCPGGYSDWAAMSGMGFSYSPWDRYYVMHVCYG